VVIIKDVNGWGTKKHDSPPLSLWFGCTTTYQTVLSSPILLFRVVISYPQIYP
jgi:hypothetical protein